MTPVCNDTGKVSGIYKATNKINNKYYVGSSNNCNCGYRCRWNRHIRDLNDNKHPNTKFQHAWNKYGADNFRWEIIEKVEESNLLIVEQKYLDIACREKDKCYNLNFIAGKPPSSKGRIASEETKKKLSLAGRGKKRSKEFVERCRLRVSGKNNPMYGKPNTSDMKMKNSIANKGRKITELNIKILKERIGDKNPFYGRHHNEESKQKRRVTMVAKGLWKP